MPSTTRSLRVAAILSFALLLCACSKPLPGDLSVGEITPGRELAADGSITQESRTNSFWTTDDFHVAVETKGSAQNVELKARWTGPDGKVAAEATETISPNGPTVTVLSAKPVDGRWAAGDFKVEILVNGASHGTRDLVTR